MCITTQTEPPQGLTTSKQGKLLVVEEGQEEVADTTRLVTWKPWR